MDDLEPKIVEVLRRGAPLKAKEIARMLGVERSEVNHYLYSLLKHQVIQDSDYRWSLKINQQDRNRHPSKSQQVSQVPPSLLSSSVSQADPDEGSKKKLNQIPLAEKVRGSRDYHSVPWQIWATVMLMAAFITATTPYFLERMSNRSSQDSGIEPSTSGK